MVVSVSPRLRDDLEYEDPAESDPRFTLGFRSLSLEGTQYHDYDTAYDGRRLSSSPDTSALRRGRRLKQHDRQLLQLTPFAYRTVADGDVFRLVVIKPGFGIQPIDCQLLWRSSKLTQKDYDCLSYCWQSTDRTASIIVDGFRFPVTQNLLSALRSIRKPKSKVLIWIDQICINQDDVEERAQQVAIMKNIFNRSKQVIVWLDEDEDNSGNLCEYAMKMRSRGGIRASLSRILTPRQLEIAIQKLLERPWFSRVWVIPEICLAQFIKVVVGNAFMTWESLIRLVRDNQPPAFTGFAKQILPGNPRQRLAILSHMITQQRESKGHTDVSKLLILAKSSQATDIRDKVYAFYGMTIVSTTPDYTRSIESLYIDIAHNYVNNIEALYDGWKDLTEGQRTFQLMSMLYSGGALHHNHKLPSWVPDWSFPWELAPLWCTTSTAIIDIAKGDHGEGIRSVYRAGGSERDLFEVVDNGGQLMLKLSAIIVDKINMLGKNYESIDEATSAIVLAELSTENDDLPLDSSIGYMRMLYNTKNGFTGVATQGIEVGDVVALLLGGDVPVILRPAAEQGTNQQTYHLLCETFVRSHRVMEGEYLQEHWTSAHDIMLI